MANVATTEANAGIAEDCESHDPKNWRASLLKAIKGRNLAAVQLLLRSPPEENSDVLNQPLVKIDSKPVERYNGSPESFGSECHRFSLPVILAAVYGCAEILDLLCCNGATVNNKDVEGDNVIHALVWIAAFKPEKERELCGIFQRLMKLARTNENKKDLLFAEDIDGLRPLELATKLSTLLLVAYIADTEGVYKTVVTASPIARKVRYDFTEYECSGPNHRAFLTPLLFLQQNVREDDVYKDGAEMIFQHPLVSKWIEKKFRQNIRFIPFSLAIMIVSILGILFSDEVRHDARCQMDKNNVTMNTPGPSKWAAIHVIAILDFLNVTFIVLAYIRVFWVVHKSHPSGVSRLRCPRVLVKVPPLVTGGTFFLFQLLKTLVVGNV